jgi:TolB-like protein
MKKYFLTMKIIFLILASISLISCSVSYVNKRDTSFSLSSIIRPGDPIAIMPFESENALSNLGGLISDEVTANLLENVPNIKIIPTSVTRSFLLSTNMTAAGIPDFHTIHSIKEGLKCRYLLTGNFYSSIGVVQYTSTYSNRIASGSVTVRLIDCDAVTVIWAKHIQDSYQTTDYYSNGVLQTSYYTDGQLTQELIKRLGQSIAEYFY